MNTGPSIAVIVLTGFLASFGLSVLVSKLLQRTR